MCPAKAVRNCYKVKKIENLLLSTDKNWLLLATLPLLDPWLHSPSSVDHLLSLQASHRPLHSPAENSFIHLPHQHSFVAQWSVLPGGPMGPGAPRGPGRPAMMVSMTVEASWGSPSVLKSRTVSGPAAGAAPSQQAGLLS